MNEFFKDIIGKICDIETDDNYYSRYEIKDINDNWLFASDVDNTDETIYLNLRYVYSISPITESQKPDKTKDDDNGGFFKRRRKERY